MRNIPPVPSAQRPTKRAWLKALRTQQGMSISEAARRAGVSERSWLRWEGGDSTPSPEYAMVLAVLLGSDVLFRLHHEALTADLAEYDRLTTPGGAA